MNEYIISIEQLKTAQFETIGLYPEKINILDIDNQLFAVGDSALLAFMQGKNLTHVRCLASEVPVILGMEPVN